jgi:hypothetical protein
MRHKFPAVSLNRPEETTELDRLADVLLHAEREDFIGEVGSRGERHHGNPAEIGVRLLLAARLPAVSFFAVCSGIGLFA